ncbi:MAG: SMC-Scp complex subunit ScpB [Gammaproteobacteria bacterium]|nr:SMC-Scp complex subunit ScpB [Gammaproteobacteria bacterium]MCK5091162.1 SMC-Scp complex subunit ScpB [Gammaproteobacteria bacterium]
MNEQKLKNIIEAALLAAGQPLSIDQMLSLFIDQDQPKREDLRAVIKQLQEEYTDRAMEIMEVSSGFRLQVKEGFSSWVSRLWTERPSRYSRALLETLALVAYRQPITRGEIENIRGVGVSSSIMKTLLEREWVRVVGHRDVPGKPAMYGSTKKFLDYFNLKTLDELPTLAELRDLDSISNELGLGVVGVMVDGQQEVAGEEGQDGQETQADDVLAENAQQDEEENMEEESKTEPGRLTLVESADEEEIESEVQCVAEEG